MQDNADAFDMRARVVALRRHGKTVVVSFVLVVGATAAVTYTQTPLYQSTAKVALEPVRDSNELQLQNLILGTNVINTEVEVLTSTTVTEMVIEDLALEEPPRQVADRVSVRTLDGTRVVLIRATDPDPELAAQLANGYAAAYFEYRRARVLDELAAARETLVERAEGLRQDIADLEREVESSTPPAEGSVGTDDSSLLAQRDTLLNRLGQIEDQIESIGTTPDDLRGGGEVLVAAEPAFNPIVPQPLRNLTLAIILGLGLGIALALLRDYLDDGIRTDDDVRRAAGGAPIVGRITAWEDEASDQKLVTLVDPYASASEEFLAMAANVRFSLVSRTDRPDDPDQLTGRAVAVSSSSPGEGKTTVAGNLAVAAAAAGRRVILVGADLRRPTLARRFGLPEGVGLSDLIANADRMTDVEGVTPYLVDVGIPRLRLLSAGTVPPNPTELLASGQMAWVHSALTQLAHLVVYDTPPILPVADTLELSSHVDMTLLVARTETTHRRDLAHAVERLDGVGATLGGVVLNGLTATRGIYGAYGYRPQDEYRPRTHDEDATDEPDPSVQNSGPPLTSVKVRVAEPGDAPRAVQGRPGEQADGEPEQWLFR